jgi:hypothetical protein
MKTLAITSLLLFAPTVVSAAPAKDETAERVSYNDDHAPPAPADDWVELASPTPAKHGRTFITVDARYSQLKIETHKGHPVVKTLRVVFADGKQRVVKLKRQRSQVVDLGGARAIEHIVVDSDWRSKGTYTVHAIKEATGVASR